MVGPKNPARGFILTVNRRGTWDVSLTSNRIWDRLLLRFLLPILDCLQLLRLQSFFQGIGQYSSLELERMDRECGEQGKALSANHSPLSLT